MTKAKPKPAPSLTLPGGELKRLFKNAATCVARDQARPLLCCAKVDIDRDGVTIATTDSYTLLQQRRELDAGSATAGSFMVNVGEMLRWLALCPTKETATVSCTDGEVVLTFPGARFTATEVDGRYPDYEKLIELPSAPVFEAAALNPIYMARIAAVTFDGPSPTGKAWPWTLRRSDHAHPILLTASGGHISATFALMPVLTDEMRDLHKSDAA